MDKAALRRSLIDQRLNLPDRLQRADALQQVMRLDKKARGASLRFVVLDVSFALTSSAESAPIRYRQLAAGLGVDLEDRVPLAEVRPVQ
mgnify:CR=1 FL=1